VRLWSFLNGYLLLSLAGLGLLIGVPATVYVVAQMATADIDWAAIEALATVAAVVAALFAVATIAFTARELENRATELRRQSESDRASRMPYLRADVGLEGMHSPGFSPPPSGHIFEPREFQGSGEAEPLKDIAPGEPPYDGRYSLVLWVQNLQAAPLGIAYRVRVRVLVAWDEVDPGAAASIQVDFTYVAPQQVTAIRLGWIRSDIPWLVAEVVEVTYEDLFGNERLPDAHGAMRLSYDRNTGVRNERQVSLSRTSDAASGSDGPRNDRDRLAGN
jgi:hypothetical protein